MTNDELLKALELVHSKIGYVTPTDARYALWMAQFKELLVEQIRRATSTVKLAP